ncbi:NTP transferase domain-containing protein [Virgibacillus byunsanensis]|uniref:NTP transferase domain-containing protein n=1 Tax=Virgibacillus byunsanensis TaxID=570945 RepID=A0ABW3LQL4_9BACI
MSKEHISAIVLAAGFSSRMGTLKALLPWQGIPLIQYQMEQLKNAGIVEIIMVLGHKADELAQVISPYDVKSVFNEHYRDGKSSSIKKGVSCMTDNPSGIFILAVDQPVPSFILQKMVEHFRIDQPSIVIPSYQGKRGHPILFQGNLKEELLTVNEQSKGLRKVIQTYHDEISYLDVRDPAILLNLNEPNDYFHKN